LPSFPFNQPATSVDNFFLKEIGGVKPLPVVHIRIRKKGIKKTGRKEINNKRESAAIE
jgi:hypothetical protein